MTNDGCKYKSIAAGYDNFSLVKFPFLKQEQSFDIKFVQKMDGGAFEVTITGLLADSGAN